MESVIVRLIGSLGTDQYDGAIIDDLDNDAMGRRCLIINIVKDMRLPVGYTAIGVLSGETAEQLPIVFISESCT